MILKILNDKKEHKLTQTWFYLGHNLFIRYKGKDVIEIKEGY